MFEVRRAAKRKARLRLAIIGASGSGKTLSAILCAQGLGGRVVLIDTEQGSGDLYADKAEYEIIPFGPPYSPKRYCEALDAAEAAGADVIVVDSLSHAWAGEGGVLEIKDATGTDFGAWRKVSPLHTRLVERILAAKAHVICTLRTRDEWVVETNDKGKKVPRKIGLAPIQKAGVEYEFTTVLMLNQDHYAEPSKDRTGLFADEVFRISADTGRRLAVWLESGDPATAATPPEPATQTPADPHADLARRFLALHPSRAAAILELTKLTGKSRTADLDEAGWALVEQRVNQ